MYEFRNMLKKISIFLYIFLFIDLNRGWLELLKLFHTHNPSFSKVIIYELQPS